MKYDHLIQAIEDGAEEKLRDFRESKDREIREIQERAELSLHSYGRICSMKRNEG